MICVTIAEETVEKLRAAWSEAARAGIGMAEIRLDYLTEPPDWQAILRDRPSQLLVTARRTIDGGRWAGDETRRREWLDEAARNGADWVDYEVDVAAHMPRTGVGRRIVSFHDMYETPQDLLGIADRCAAGDADLVKLAVMPHGVKDACRLLDVVAASHARRPTMGLAMGDWGQFTRVVNAVFGVSWTYAAIDAAQAAAPGMLSLKELVDVYGYDRIGQDTTVCAVIGDPIRHSKSPLIHNAAFRHHGLDAVYVPIRVADAELDWFMRHFHHYRITGLSVTIPHKERVIAALKKADDLVRLTGSCNTLIARPDMAAASGVSLVGHNTDLAAALDSLEEALKAKYGSARLAERNVLLLGAGGVARSLAFGLAHRGAEVTIVNRTRERAATLASAAGVESADWASRSALAKKAEIVINATSLGMSPRLEESPLDPGALSSGHIVFDTIYAPEWTTLLKHARAAGAVTLSGVDMFIRQAAAQSALFTDGLDPPTDVMAASLRMT
jgi:3-dehydroquinate dehydratase/shikimate dehydrogenase